MRGIERERSELMHEYAIAKQLLTELIAEARKHKASKLVSARIRLSRDLGEHTSKNEFQLILAQLASARILKNAKFTVEIDEKNELKEGQFCILEIEVK